MSPDQARDKISFMHEDRDVHARVASVFDHAVGVVMARFCYTREEAESAARAHFAVRPARPRKRAQMEAGV